MSAANNYFFSSTGQKFINAITGLGLVVFIIIHLIGNLILLTGDAVAFNEYSYFYVKIGYLLYLIEIGLLFFLILHIITSVAVWWSKQKGRDQSYQKSQAAGGPSKKTIASQTMIYTGVIILIFLILHLIDFKYGPYYPVDQSAVTTTYNMPPGTEVRNLHKTVVADFLDIGMVIWYIAAVLILGVHLRHGFWSAFQSLGFNHPKYTPMLFRIGLIVGILIGLGYAVIPLVVYLKGGAA